jgi:hypothetical protein
MVEIPLTQGKVAIVDDEWACLAEFKWTARRDRDSDRWYARRGGPDGREIKMHRVILGITDRRLDTDHKNGDGLDNRDENLRPATRSQNLANQRVNRQNTSGFKGVYWDSGTGSRNKRWRARIKVNGKSRPLGGFASREEAGRAYDAAAREIHGEFACVNFPREGERGAR